MTETVDVQLYKKNFRTSLHSADSKCPISLRWSKNGSECTSFCAPKVLQDVNFQKKNFSSCIQDGLWLCTYVSVFFCGIRWRHNRAPNLEPRFLVNSVPVWGRIASPIMHRFGHCLRHLLQDQIFFVTHCNWWRKQCPIMNRFGHCLRHLLQDQIFFVTH